jgi:hypothetical protein
MTKLVWTPWHEIGWRSLTGQLANSDKDNQFFAKARAAYKAFPRSPTNRRVIVIVSTDAERSAADHLLGRFGSSWMVVC